MNIRAKIFDGAAEEPLLKAKRPAGSKFDELHSVAVAREWRHRSDSRGEVRHRLIGEHARVTYNGATYHAEVINLSDGGAMIEGPIDPMLWERIYLHLGEHGDIECAVCWIRDGRIGLEFAHETRIDGCADEVASVLRNVIARTFPGIVIAKPKPLVGKHEKKEAAEEGAPHFDPDEQRVAPRHSLVWRGTLYHDFQTTKVRVRNISNTGAMIEVADPVRVGATPLLELSDAVSISATVEWAMGDQIGLRFNDPFNMRLLAESKPAVAASNTWLPPAYLATDADNRKARPNHWNHLTIDELCEELEGFLKR